MPTHEFVFRAVLDDGSTIEWEQPIEVNGVMKPASIDDLDRAHISNLLTVNQHGEVMHAIGFPKEQRHEKLAVWRLTRMIDRDTGEVTTLGALSGYNEQMKDGASKLTLYFVNSDTGKVTDVSWYNLSLHPREVFTKEEAAEITAFQEAQNEVARIDAAEITEAREKDAADAAATAETLPTSEAAIEELTN